MKSKIQRINYLDEFEGIKINQMIEVKNGRVGEIAFIRKIEAPRHCLNPESQIVFHCQLKPAMGMSKESLELFKLRRNQFKII